MFLKRRTSRLNSLATAIFKLCIYLLPFCFIFPNYNTTFPLFIANKKIKKNNSEQLWYCQTNRKHWKTNFFSQGCKLFQNERNAFYALCTYVTPTITYICNKDVFILYLWSLLWRVFQKFLVFLFSSEKKLCFKIQEINKQTQTKWFLFLKKDYLNR